jgi:hypothetical protein
MATDFFVYYSDGVDYPPSPFLAETQNLIPFLDAEDAGAATVTEINLYDPTQQIQEGHSGPDVEGNQQYSFPFIVAVRSGRVIKVYNIDTAGDLAVTILDPGGALASDTLDGLETQTIEQEGITEEAEVRASDGNALLRDCEQALLGGDILTGDQERGCFANLVRSELGLPLTDTRKFIAEVETDLEAFASDTDGVDDVGTGGGMTDPEAIHEADFAQTEGFMRKIAARSYEAVKSNLSATAAPTVTDDEDAGYGLWSQWLDVNNDIAYLCLDATSGAAVWQALGAPGGGEANGGANVGAGAQVFRDKTGVTLNFRTLTTPLDKLSAVVNGDEIELGLGASLILDDIPDVEITDPEAGQVLTLYECPAGVYTWKNMPVGGASGAGGFVVDAENIGSGGVGIFKAKNGATLQFKKINAEDAKITVTDDVGNNEVDIGFGVVPIDALDDVDTTTTPPDVGVSLVWNGLDWVPENAFPGASVRDRQVAQANDEPTETSGTWVDIPGMTVTTVNAAPLDYVVTLSLEVENSNSNRTMDFRVLVGGAENVYSVRAINVPGASSPRPISLTFSAPAVGNGVEIKAQWQTNGGTMTARARSLVADGEL